MDCSPPGSSVHGIRQARILEWLAFHFPGSLPDPRIEPGSPVMQVDSLLSEPPRLGAIKVKKKKKKTNKQTRNVQTCSLFFLSSLFLGKEKKKTQSSPPFFPLHCNKTLLSMGFSKQEYWSGLPCPSPGDLPNPGIEPASLTSPALAGGFFTTSATWEAYLLYLEKLVTVTSLDIPK